MIESGGLRYRRLWLAIGWATVATVIVLSLVRLDVDLSEGRDKWSHFIAYGAQAFWFGMLYPRRWTVIISFIALGVFLEFAQGLTSYRNFDSADMVANTLGVLLGSLAAQTRLRCLLSWLEAGFLRFSGRA